MVGHNIRRLRTEAGLSQKALGDLMGVSNGRISDYESGIYACTLDMIERIADALGVRVAALFDEENFDDRGGAATGA